MLISTVVCVYVFTNNFSNTQPNISRTETGPKWINHVTYKTTPDPNINRAGSSILRAGMAKVDLDGTDDGMGRNRGARSCWVCRELVILRFWLRVPESIRFGRNFVYVPLRVPSCHADVGSSQSKNWVIGLLWTHATNDTNCELNTVEKFILLALFSRQKDFRLQQVFAAVL